MADLSKFGFVADEAKPTGKSTDLSKFGFVETPMESAQPSTDVISSNSVGQLSPQPVEDPRSLVQKAAESPIVQGTLATGSSIREGLTDFGSEMGSFVSELVGKVNADAGLALNQKGKEFKDYMNANENAIFDKAKVQAEYPVASAIGKGIGYTAGVTGASAIGGTSYPGIAAQAGIGSAMAGEGNRIKGAIGGAIIPAVAKAVIGSPASMIAASSMQKTQIGKVAETLNKAPDVYPNMDIHEATNAAFSRFKGIEGAIDSTLSQNAISSFVKGNGKFIPKQQLAVITDIANDVKTAKSLEELHIARKNLDSALDPIVGAGNLSKKQYTQIKDLKKIVEANLQNNAKQLGALDQYQEANTLFKQSKEADIINDALKSSQLPEGGNNWLQFNNKIIKLRADKAKALSEPTKKMLEGVQKTLTEANHIYGIRTKELGMIMPAIAVIKGMFNFPAGQQMLLRLGTQQGRALSSAFVKGLANMLQAKTITGGQAAEPSLPQAQDPSLGVQ